MPEETYELRLLCTNCMYKWDEPIPKGEQFYSRGFQQSAGYGTASFHAHDNKINCPNCGCNTVRSQNWQEADQECVENAYEKVSKPTILDEDWSVGCEGKIVSMDGILRARAYMNNIGQAFDDAVKEVNFIAQILAAAPDAFRAVIVMRDGCIESTAMHKVAVDVLKKAGIEQ